MRALAKGLDSARGLGIYGRLAVLAEWHLSTFVEIDLSQGERS